MTLIATPAHPELDFSARLECFFTADNTAASQAIPIHLFTPSSYSAWLTAQAKAIQTTLNQHDFHAKDGQRVYLHDSAGQLSAIVVGLGEAIDYAQVGKLPSSLPKGRYKLGEVPPQFCIEHATLLWGQGNYQFGRYKTRETYGTTLAVAKSYADFIREEAASYYLIRDLINTPVNDMGPEELAAVVAELAEEYGASYEEIVGEELLTQNYPMIYAVGKGSVRAPRLLDLRYGNPSHPKITLVGKGVCFDSGGLDIKSSGDMRLMKKDMGGAAHAIGLARLIMSQKLPVCLRLLVPAVENAVGGASYRPGDVLTARNGRTVEITNTDAEGRLVLADALVEAASESPEYLFDFATLTGAARVALGPDVVAVMTRQDELMHSLSTYAEKFKDPMWRLPLVAAYKRYIKSDVADCSNAALVSYGGAITAALFLHEFVPKTQTYAHFDLFAWTPEAQPGRPVGAHVQAIRTVYGLIKDKVTS